MNGESYNPGVFPRDMGGWARLHEAQLVNPALLDPDARLNQSAIIDTDLFSGVEAWDYQNPYVWQSRQLLTVATLDPSYGLYGDTSASVVHNVGASAGLLGV